MDAYKNPYLTLFTCISRALEAIEEMDFGKAKALLKEGQSKAEDAYLEATDPLEEDKEKTTL